MSDDHNLTDYDAVLLDQDDLDEFMAAHAEGDDLLRTIDVFTEDEFTKNKVEFNLIVGDRDDYGIGTQLHCPFASDDAVLDLRSETGGFDDWVMGLAS